MQYYIICIHCFKNRIMGKVLFYPREGGGQNTPTVVRVCRKRRLKWT
jgi:hypothetical protein